MSTDASATSQPETPEIDCPLCGEVVRQVSSATLSLALSQHVRWVCARRALSPPPDVERLTREAFRAGFLAVCRKKSDDTPLDMLTRVWTFDGVAAADLESEAYAAWRALSPSTPGEPT